MKQLSGEKWFANVANYLSENGQKFGFFFKDFFVKSTRVPVRSRPPRGRRCDVLHQELARLLVLPLLQVHALEGKR